jgi:hypothetical protein
MEAAIKGADKIGFTIVSMSISDRSVHFALPDGRNRWPAVPRVCRARRSVDRRLLGRIADADANDVCPLVDAGTRQSRVHVEAIERFFDWLVAVYDRGLAVAVRYRRITLTIMVRAVCLTMVLFVWIPKGFFPQEDTGLIIPGHLPAIHCESSAGCSRHGE